MEVMDEVRVLLRDADPDGELPPCHLRSLVLGRDALEQVPELLDVLLRETGADADGRVVLLVDPTLIVREGADVKLRAEQLLAERFDTVKAVLDDGHDELHVVDEVVAAAAEAARGAAAVVALGGGTVSDIGKLAVAACEPPPVLVTLQTAASVDGYTDDVSVLLRDGVKRTVPSRWPDAVVADAQTIAEAPVGMTCAGFGEMTSMLTAPADWYLASLVGASGFHDGPIRLLDRVGDGLAQWSVGVGSGDPAAVERLTHALAVRGIVTGVAGTTAALSGVEHLVSHMLDLHHAEHDLRMGLHGAQVGVGAVVAAACWELLADRMADETPTLTADALDEDAAHQHVLAAFGHLDERIVAECWSDYAAKLRRLDRERVEAVLGDWPRHVKRLGELVRPSAEIAERLAAAGATASFAALDPAVGPGLARWAVANCALMRNRFTVVDLLMLLGWWGEAEVDEVFERVARVTS
ncbi:iron-containing alcohol dehydrogenase [Nocardioides mangrovicus]|uniref:Iron-containing alcohol dehydrogenase n=1 Tax=Nocardioides mangrovicus TaxID=2478913 RepID=A0A3L8P6R2_9ACTN|nr:iron-containing alcohol dehydrogenase [Nocardioides mangrovicus]RLV50931.1 iron-containing alcohol dehydrogenase [Nocardioides mangrovicus]